MARLLTLGMAAALAALAVPGADAIDHLRSNRASATVSFGAAPKGAPELPAAPELDPVNFQPGSACYFGEPVLTTTQQCADKYDAKAKEIHAMKPRDLSKTTDDLTLRLATMMQKAPVGKENAEMMQYQSAWMESELAAANLYDVFRYEADHLSRGIDYAANVAAAITEKMDEFAKGTTNPIRCPSADGCLMDKLKDALNGPEALALGTQLKTLWNALRSLKGDVRDLPVVDIVTLGKGLGPKIAAFTKLVAPLKPKLAAYQAEVMKKVGDADIITPKTRDPNAPVSFMNEVALASAAAERICHVIPQVFTGISCDGPDAANDAAAAALDPIFATVAQWELFLRVRRPDAKLKKTGATFVKATEAYKQLSKFIADRRQYFDDAELIHIRGRGAKPCDFFHHRAQQTCGIGVDYYRKCDINGLTALCAVANTKSDKQQL